MDSSFPVCGVPLLLHFVDHRLHQHRVLSTRIIGGPSLRNAATH